MSTDTGWEVFRVIYQLPKFGTEGLFNKETKRMTVATGGGKEDAKAACQKYHPGSRVVLVIDTNTDDKVIEDLTNQAVEKLGGYS